MPDAAIQVVEPSTGAEDGTSLPAHVDSGQNAHVAEPNLAAKAQRPDDVHSEVGDEDEIYVEKAGEHDRALFKRWNEEIDVFLIFTGLFSAVLSAFLIFSLASLQPDSGQATADGLAAISAQLVIMSGGILNATSAYQSQPFQPSSTAVAVNVLWFISLFVSLLAAVTAMLVKEWLREYDEHVSPVPRERVYQRQLRFECLNVWMVPSIIAILPLLDHVAVFLFFAGLVLLAKAINVVLCWILFLMFLVGLALYLGSSIAPLVWMDSPYKSPLFKALQRVLQLVYPSSVPPWRHILCLDEIMKNRSTRNPKGKDQNSSDDVERGLRTIEENTEGAVSAGDVYQKTPPPQAEVTITKPTLRRTSRVAQFGSVAHDQRAEARLREELQERLNVHVFSWLMTHPDPSTRYATLYFLGWHRLPEWLVQHGPLRKEVGGAAVSYVEEHQLANAEKDLESLAVISCITRDLEYRPAVDQFWAVHTDKLRTESLPNTYEDNLVALVAANLYAEYPTIV